MAQKIDLLVNLDMPEYTRNYLAEKYEVHYRPNAAEHPQLLKDPLLKRIRAVQTNGSYGLKRDFIEAMPNLEIICAVGAGFEGIDVAAAREHGIIVTHSPGANADSVADQGWAVLLGVMRQVPACDKGVREGRWLEVRGEMPSVTGKKLGIFGLGHVGKAMAKRGALGFDMDVGYASRRYNPETPYRYFASLAELADWADILAICAPGGPATYHLVDADILRRLGPDGFLVNVSRGGLVDTNALIDALANGRIAGAGLDVVEGEPDIPAALCALPNVVLSPHTGGMSPDAIRNMIQMVRKNLDAHFSGQPVLTPVPE